MHILVEIPPLRASAQLNLIHQKEIIIKFYRIWRMIYMALTGPPEANSFDDNKYQQWNGT